MLAMFGVQHVSLCNNRVSRERALSGKSFVSFSWPVPRAEDLCLARDAQEQEFIVWRSSRLTNGRADPLDPRNLGNARTFADITTPQQVLDFVGNHGLLGFRPAGWPTGGFMTEGPLTCDGEPLGQWFLAEPIRLWLKAASALRWMVDLSDAIGAEDEQRIAELVVREPKRGPGGDIVAYKVDPDESVAERMNDVRLFPGEAVTSWLEHPDEFHEIPRQVLASVVNSALQGVSPILVADRGEPLAFRLHPHSLWGALIVQLAQGASGGTTFKKCEREGCSEYFPVTPHVARKNKKYCSDACKSGAWRSRKPKGDVR